MLKLLLHPGHNRDDQINLRRFFLFYTVYLCALAGLAQLGFYHYQRGGMMMARNIWLLAIYLFYLSLCCTFFPAPTAWIVLLMASPVVSLVPPEVGQGPWLTAGLTVASVAAVGALGTAMANLNEYHIFTFMLRFGRENKIRQSRLYKTASNWFSVSPFSLITAFSFLPVPVDVIRWLAIANRYRRDHYILANFLGRLARYSIMAAAATSLKLTLQQIAAIQIGLALLVVVRFIPKLINRRGSKDSHDA